MVACSAVRPVDSVVESVPRRDAVAALPSARIYKVDSQWAYLVPVTVSNGTLVSWPAPGDVRSATAPLALADGWWLDRQGVNPNTMFLKWTRGEYASMANTPDAAEIKAAVIPGSRLSELVELPLTTSSAVDDTAAVNQLILKGLPGCKQLIQVLHFHP